MIALLVVDETYQLLLSLALALGSWAAGLQASFVSYVSSPTRGLCDEYLGRVNKVCRYLLTSDGVFMRRKKLEL